MPAFAIEIDGEHNEQLYFRPIGRTVRGRFDLMRLGEPQARVKASQWPVIPSQRIGIDDNGKGFIEEPLHDTEFETVREKILAEGMKLEPQRQTFDDVHEATWLHYLKQAVDAGIAKIVSGKLPRKIEGTPQTSFVVERQQDPVDKLTAAIERQTAAFEALLTKLSEK